MWEKGWPSRDRKNSFSRSSSSGFQALQEETFLPCSHVHSRKMKARRPQRLPGWEREVVNEVPTSSTDTTPSEGHSLRRESLTRRVSRVPLLTYQPLSCKRERHFYWQAGNEAPDPLLRQVILAHAFLTISEPLGQPLQEGAGPQAGSHPVGTWGHHFQL